MTKQRAAELAHQLALIILEVARNGDVPVNSGVVEFQESLEIFAKSIDKK